MLNSTRLVLVLFVLFVMSAVSVLAQTGTSNITGRVVDSKEALLPGATVTLKNEATGATQTQTTSDAGVYAFSLLPVGAYTVSVEARGFKTFTSIGNMLTVGVPLVVNVTMEVGQPTEVVEVTAAYERLETTSAMLGGVVDRRAIEQLPLNGRNPLNLIVLEPGLVQRTNNGAGSGTHVFGSRDRAHNVTIDGIDANESSVPNPQSNIFRLTPDNVQEYRVVTHNATPEFGRNSGANVTVATRSGTNEFHGDLFYFHRNTALNANEWFNNASGIERPILLLHQFGADGGGPIIKNKTFFFGSWQNNRIKQTQPIAATFGVPRVYTPTLRSGVFRFVVGTVNGLTANSPLLVDSAGNLKPGILTCGGAVTTNCVASYNIFARDPLGVGADPTIAKMVSTFPLPNSFNVGDGLNFAGFAWNPPSRFKGPFYMFRVDHKFNDENDIFGRFLWSDYDTFEGDLLNSRPAIFPGFPPLGEVFRRSQSLAVSYRRVFSPTFVNEFTAGYSRFRFFFSLRESQKGIDPPPYGQECFGDDSFRTIDTPFCNTPHTKRIVTARQFIDNVSYTRGTHSFRAGFNFRFYSHDDERGVPGGFNSSPTIVFDRVRRSPVNETPAWPGIPSAPTGINSTDRNNLLNAIVELAGIPGQVQQAFQAKLGEDAYGTDLFTLETRARQFNFYFQDEWKLRSNLTVNYGLRWELNRPPTDAGGRVFVPDLPVDGSQGRVTYVPAKSWWQRGNNNAFGPRVGLAWTPWNNTVIRAGYGIAFDTLSTFQATAVGGKVPGSVQQCRVNVQDAVGTTGCQDIPNNVRLTQLLAAINPFTLALPTKKPSAGLSPENEILGVAPNVGAFDPNLQIPTVHEWSLTVQRELPWNFVGQVGYIGKRGTHLYRAYDLNQLRTDQPGFLQSFLIARDNVRRGCRADGTDDPAISGTCVGTPPSLLLQLIPASQLNGFSSDFLQNGLGTIASRIDRTNIVARGFPANYFRPNAQFSEIFYFDSGGDSYYHGAIAQLRRRFEQGLDFGLSYTFSKSIDNMSVDPVAATSGGGLGNNSRTPTDVRNFLLDRSVSDFDNRHVLVVNSRYELPVGRGRMFGGNMSGALNQILGDWSLTGIYTYQSGEPFTINSGSATANFTNAGKQTRADLRGPLPPAQLQFVPGVQGPVVFNVTSLDQNTNCRQVVGTNSFFCIPEPGGFGMGRNAVRGPGFWNFDLGVLKRFKFNERVNLQFRAEFFNVFNHPNFENPRNATEGSPTLTSSAFGQTCCVTSSVVSSSTIIAIGEPNRVIQFALKLQF